MEMKAGLGLRFVTANPRDILNEKFSMKDRNHLNYRKNTSENYKKRSIPPETGQRELCEWCLGGHAGGKDGARLDDPCHLSHVCPEAGCPSG